MYMLKENIYLISFVSPFRQQRARASQQQPMYAGEMCPEDYSAPPASQRHLYYTAYSDEYADALRAQLKEGAPPMLVEMDKNDIRGYQTTTRAHASPATHREQCHVMQGQGQRLGHNPHVYESPKCPKRETHQ